MSVGFTGNKISSAACLYTGTSADLTEEEIAWPSVTMDSSGLGIITAQMLTTVNLLAADTYSRISANNLFSDPSGNMKVFSNLNSGSIVIPNFAFPSYPNTTPSGAPYQAGSGEYVITSTSPASEPWVNPPAAIAGISTTAPSLAPITCITAVTMPLLPSNSPYYYSAHYGYANAQHTEFILPILNSVYSKGYSIQDTGVTATYSWSVTVGYGGYECGASVMGYNFIDVQYGYTWQPLAGYPNACMTFTY